MNALTEFTALALSRPGPDAPTERVAAWYEAKGRLHEHLASGADPMEAAGELAHAAAAYEHARRLTGPVLAGCTA
ncbi:MAG TPA: hypothetical protein VHX38_00650 [Pseudonocardiaceae bacterium]|jgi:hypothetical protein|nr:hypothetical protein [Pseudonocardiaceae bacterium]